MNKYFSYNLGIDKDSLFFNDPKIKSLLPIDSSLFIMSNKFDNYDVCFNYSQLLLEKINANIYKSSKKKYVIISKINPLLTGTDNNESWANNILAKSYLADADSIKHSNIIYTAVSMIFISPNITSLSDSEVQEISA